MLKNIKYFKYLFKYLKDSDYPILEKIYIAAGVFYIVFPYDVLPEPIFPFGVLDDSVIFITLIYYLGKLLNTYYLDKIKTQEAFDVENAIKADYEEVKPGGEHETGHKRDTDW
ncbi:MULTISPECIES: YkvA family protein [unclassified Fusibacter]|uniref:YkvA family protein n=1 Tax=unclassified Fusibacter TaxID=2624464 RepID=UPI0010113A13|nr:MULTISPECIES: YkvA family protein [unclassified Fusibacter]MCK8058253.1 YkvA family protein [Fusibacter sp. A2]NPE20836.1 DUF1232 domain-containing protein [Fusibacter sp. A1]RXV63041.1 DUF1232 domain-containing protein [Fusibacter sp. A1]